MHELFKEPFTPRGRRFTITASLGISVFPRDADDAHDTPEPRGRRDVPVEGEGPGGTVVFSPDRENPMLRLRLATQLRQAVERQSWVLHYQPIVDLVDGALQGVEALIRGVTENGDLIPPLDFIPLAEEIGLIEAIGDWVIGEMCRQIQAWNDADSRSRSPSTCLPGSSGRPGSPRSCWTRARRPARPPSDRHRDHRIDRHDGPGADREILQALHDAGFQIAIDDFGTGYSSLARLRDLPSTS